MNPRSLITLSLLAAAGAAPALAATATVNVTLNVGHIADTGNGFTGSVQGAPAYAPPVGFDLAEGDTLDFTVQFDAGQSLSLAHPTALWSFIFADTVSDVTGTGTLSLLDSAGAVLYTSAPLTSTEGAVHFGQYFTDADFGGLPASVSFSGMRYVGTLADYVDPGVTTRHYADPAFSFVADSFVASVPEPGAWALMLAGLAAVGWRARRLASA